MIEYVDQGKHKRAEYYFYLRTRLKENAEFSNIFTLVDQDSLKLSNIPLKDKKEFLDLFQEVALMRKAGLIKKKLALFMFGYFAIRCLESKNFWEGLNPDDHYWKLFREFTAEAKQEKNEPLLYAIESM